MKTSYRAIIGREFIDSDEKIEVKNPLNDSILTRVAVAGEDLFSNAIEKGISAQREYIRMPIYERAAVLLKASEEITKNKEHLARIITLESGKPIKDARAEVDRASIVFRVAYSLCEEERGEFISLEKNPVSKRHFGIVRRFPLGLGIGITPFNFPLNLVAHKIAPALASGNAIIIKPASKTPVSALLLADILNSAGLMDGMLSVLPSRPEVIERILAQNNSIKYLTFTGSSSVGWHLKSLFPKKKVLLELGGNAGLIIDRDVEIASVVKKAVYGAFAYSGQICISVQRIFVHRDIFDKFLDTFVAATQELRLGDPLSENVDIGPIIDRQSIERIISIIDEAKRGGAKVLTGGEVVDNILKPIVLTNTKPDMRVNSQEIFGPVVSIERIESIEEGIECVNSSIYGLQAGIFTNNVYNAFLAYEKIETGGVIVNNIPTFRSDNMPYGGIKESGFGREGVRYAMEELTEPRLMVLNLNV